MKKVSKILLIVGGALQIMAALTFLGLGIMFIVMASMSQEAIIEGINNGTIQNNTGLTAEEAANVIIATFAALGMAFMVCVPFEVAGAVISILASFKGNKVLHILAIVFGVITGVEVPAVGGIFGLITEQQI